MRTRTRIQRGFLADTLPTLTSITNTSPVGEVSVEYQHGSIAVPEEPLWSYSRFFDEDPKLRNEHLSHECLHYSGSSRSFGTVPSWRPNFSQPYISFEQASSTSTSVKVVQTPLAPIVAAGLLAFPELGRVPHLEDFFAVRDYPNTFLSGRWKGPKLSLSRGFSLPNFLLEWRESIVMISSWLSKRGLLERWHDLRARNESLPVKARALANERLAYVYGTKTFISDARALFTILRSWKERADRFLADAGKLKKCYRATLPYHLVVESPLRSVPVADARDSQMTVTTSVDMECHATLGYTYSVAAILNYINRIAQLSDSLGIRLDAGIIWDAIPFSFVVDWFINISEWLHSNVSRDWINAELTILDYCHSGKVTCSRSLYWVFDDNPSGSTPYIVRPLIWEDINTYYRRQRGKCPEVTTANLDLARDPWRITRILNATSLGGQKLLKRRVLLKSGKTKQVDRWKDKKAAKAYFDRKAINQLINSIPVIRV